MKFTILFLASFLIGATTAADAQNPTNIIQDGIEPCERDLTGETRGRCILARTGFAKGSELATRFVLCGNLCDPNLRCGRVRKADGGEFIDCQLPRQGSPASGGSAPRPATPSNGRLPGVSPEGQHIDPSVICGRASGGKKCKVAKKPTTPKKTVRKPTPKKLKQ